MNIKTVLKSSVAVAALFAVAAPVANAADDTFKSGNKNSLTISGQVVQSLFWADDGVSDAMFHSGGKVTGSRVRWIASGKLNENVTAGATIEMNIPLANSQGGLTLQGGSAAVGTDGEEAANGSAWGIRQEYVWVNHKKMGKLTLGNTDGASNGKAEVNFIGISGEDTNGVTNGTGIAFINRTAGVGGEVTGTTIGDSVTNYDGASRQTLLRYDTPTFFGLSLRMATLEGGNFDVGLGYSGKFGPIKVKAGAGYYDSSATSNNNYTTSGSIAIMHDSGLNVNFAIGKTQPEGIKGAPGDGATVGTQESGVVGKTTWTREAAHFIYYSLGYNAKIFGVGGTNFGVSFQGTDNKTKNTAEFEAITVSAEQSFSAIGAKVMLQYSNMSLDEKTSGVVQTFDDIDVFTVQTIFTF